MPCSLTLLNISYLAMDMCDACYAANLQPAFAKWQCMQEIREAESTSKAHEYLQPSALRRAWAEVLRSVQQESRSVIMVPRVAHGHASMGRDQPQNAADSGGSKVNVATSDLASQHGVLHPGDVCFSICCTCTMHTCYTPTSCSSQTEQSSIQYYFMLTDQ